MEKKNKRKEKKIQVLGPAGSKTQPNWVLLLGVVAQQDPISLASLALVVFDSIFYYSVSKA
jgi:hypothetical protein